MSDFEMEFTGERMVPETADSDMFWEHIYRYRFASRFVRGKRVLDVACGEGYGTYGLLKAGASSIVGVDIAQEACDHARKKYGIDAQCGSGTAMPLANHSIDVVVSFETIEHVAEQDAFVAECCRVLGNSGMLVISTPNRDIYSDKGARNPFHCKELNKEEFVQLLSTRFKRVQLHTQTPREAGAWSARSLAAARSPWRNTPGYWWLRGVLARSAPYQESPEAHRGLSAELIRGTDAALSGLANPYLVRRFSRFAAEMPRYLIAVCDRLRR